MQGSVLGVLLVVVLVVVEPSHHGGHQDLHLLAALPARLQDLVVVGFLPAVVVHHRTVADQRHGEAAHPCVTGDDHLVNGAHPCGEDKEEEEMSLVLLERGIKV